jgi:hypothetical protein
MKASCFSSISFTANEPQPKIPKGPSKKQIVFFSEFGSLADAATQFRN